MSPSNRLVKQFGSKYRVWAAQKLKGELGWRTGSETVSETQYKVGLMVHPNRAWTQTVMWHRIPD